MSIHCILRLLTLSIAVETIAILHTRHCVNKCQSLQADHYKLMYFEEAIESGRIILTVFIYFCCCCYLCPVSIKNLPSDEMVLV